MKVEVDAIKCETVGICVMECPEVFRFTAGSKKAEVSLQQVPSHLQAKCREIAERCPKGAIRIIE